MAEAVVALNPLYTETPLARHSIRDNPDQPLPPDDRPAAFSQWTLRERLAFIDRVQAIFDGAAQDCAHRSVTIGGSLPSSMLRAAAESYLALPMNGPDEPRHMGNQLMPSQTKSHLHPLATFALLADALFLGCFFRRLAPAPVTIRGSRTLHTAGRDGVELFGTFIQAAPASSTGYFEHKYVTLRLVVLFFASYTVLTPVSPQLYHVSLSVRFPSVTTSLSF
jgi:hypothetical protein